MKLNEIMDKDSKYYMNTFGERINVSFEYGQGISLFDNEGAEFRDFLGGMAVNALGHGHPTLVNAIANQAQKLIHCSSLYYIENQSLLAEKIVENSVADKVFFGNSGAEANEGAIKLARLYFKKKGSDSKYEIITLINSFHGRTLGALAATGQYKYHEPYKPLLPGFSYSPINDFETLLGKITENTCAIMLEPVQGESGVNPCTQEFLTKVSALCQEKEILLIFDEIQTGMGRTGKFFGYENFGIEPDIFTLAKALGGGMPIGAVCAKDFVAKAFAPGDHGSTFGGNPLACAAGLAVFKAIEEENLISNAKSMGEYLMSSLKELQSRLKGISEIRGLGLMIGIEFNEKIAKDVRVKMHEKGYLIGNTGETVVRVLPPLIINKDEIDGFLKAFEEVLE